MTRLVLGSASSGRLSVLRKAGVDPVVLVSDVDEDAIIAALGDAGPSAIVQALATAKAERVAELVDAGLSSDCVVIGCDSMLEFDGRLTGKPGTPDVARRQWNSMAGRSAVLHTGHCVIRLKDGAVTAQVSELGSTTVYFGQPSPTDLDAYLASGEPLWVAGAFTLDGLGGWFIDRIDGDPSNVIGLSLPLLRQMLTQLGVSVAALWSANPAA
ncbi:septum formation inhibitor Maf [Mycobacterium sp. CBMA293]|uniref:Maf family protein n=1 Tax=unclassified Mycolicibacterium TaxID=2636767 RepID=UPI0012DCB595|nr:MULTISPECIES: nucleoside triphosphate pyrophosphatase [unclassified Mycolicibacterium]MUL46789.1 septum formation inhibitor Maf [Mycolicibacterium sp. CBMA 360]MUL57426.1 septum formation inhibitor Maf [Mycolicibacterium sp. CBMA 335]MUL70466.1 septum formation inhibitor Maf [Mycolicibacterium sp. CBMA 311]MUL92514.1 septum formation inhibitor Maf [Mycolicibacterium sp. CBMA 230]MUM04889.1 septum formation inhibitor Maf [Mycolicibacterium sp. CBMA 213]